jgi:PAS domain S-box-containing protein
LAVPIVGPEGQNIGLIQLSDKYQGEFTEADEAILIQLANIAAATIENARLYDELRESEERYRTLVENFPGGAVTLYDEDLRYIAAGGENVRRVGRTVDDLVGSKVHDAIPDELADQLAPHYRAAIEEEEQQTFEAEYDGTYYLFHALPVRDEVGDVYAGMGMSQDITKQKERQRALEEYKAIIETIPDGVYILDEDHRFQLVNEAFFELTGYPREELLGSDPKRVSPEVGHERGLVLRKQLRTGVIEVAVHEQTILTADGDTFDAEIRFVALDDEDDDFRGTAGVIRDITERKEHEQELEQYRALTQAANDTIITIDDTSTIQSVNPAVEAIFGYEPEELIGERLTVLMPNELAERHLDAVSQYLATGERTLNWEYIELPGQHQNGSEIPLAISFNEAEHAADQFFTGIVRDISERKEYERKLEESNERLEQFAYAVSHDLQEPLRMVSSYLQLLENRYRDELDDDAREFIDFAVDGADRMSDMIEGLLEYSRVESQGDPFERVELDSILDDVREDLQFQIEESGAEITADTLPRVEGDANQLRQVLQNLVENAIAYSGEAPPCVHVSAKRTGSECVVSVEDDGIGIDRDEQDRIFEVFQRLHTHDEGAGTGIGLALCRRIVERHGGEIWVESDPGEGSTFYFTLPDIGHYSENH